MISYVQPGDQIRADEINAIADILNGSGIPSNGSFRTSTKGTLFYELPLILDPGGSGSYEQAKFLQVETRSMNELTSRTQLSSSLSNSYNYYFINLGPYFEGALTPFNNLFYNGREVLNIVFVNYQSASMDGYLMSSDYGEVSSDPVTGQLIIISEVDGFVNTGCDDRRKDLFGLFLNCTRIQDLSIEVSGQISVVTAPYPYLMYCVSDLSWQSVGSEPGHPEGPQINELCSRIQTILNNQGEPHPEISNLVTLQLQNICGHGYNLSSGPLIQETLGSQFLTKKGSDGFEHPWKVDPSTGMIERPWAMVGTTLFDTHISATILSGYNYLNLDMEQLTGELLSAPYEDATHCSFLVFDWDQGNLLVSYYDIYPKVNCWERYAL